MTSTEECSSSTFGFSRVKNDEALQVWRTSDRSDLFSVYDKPARKGSEMIFCGLIVIVPGETISSVSGVVRHDILRKKLAIARRNTNIS